MTRSSFGAGPVARLAEGCRARAVVGLAVIALATVGLTGCQSDQDTYCDAVKAHQTKLSQILGSGDKDALLNALPIFRDLQGKSPGDVRDDWKRLVGALGDLESALKRAGVDPATYDRDHLPAGVTQAERDQIDSAASELSSPATVHAFESVQQEARDVCQTPLSL